MLNANTTTSSSTATSTNTEDRTVIYTTSYDVTISDDGTVSWHSNDAAAFNIFRFSLSPPALRRSSARAVLRTGPASSWVQSAVLTSSSATRSWNWERATPIAAWAKSLSTVTDISRPEAPSADA